MTNQKLYGMYCQHQELWSDNELLLDEVFWENHIAKTDIEIANECYETKQYSKIEITI